MKNKITVNPLALAVVPSLFVPLIFHKKYMKIEKLLIEKSIGTLGAAPT